METKKDTQLIEQHPSSYRDPAGFVFRYRGEIYRQVNRSYGSAFNRLMSSGLYKKLTTARKLVSHEEAFLPDLPEDAERLVILKPEQLQSITYPVEWSFTALQDAALLHLDIMLFSIGHGMILKDATPSNVQFEYGSPLVIDTLSFDLYDEQRPWVAYRQFCEMFLYPLLLEHYGKLFIHQYFAAAKEGISARQTAALLPARSRFQLGCWFHVFLPARMNTTNTGKTASPSFSKQKMQQLITHLAAFVRSLKPGMMTTANWNAYYSASILGDGYLQNKTGAFETLLRHQVFGDIATKTVLDIGANNGHFSRLMAKRALHVTAIDNDAPSIDHLYKEIRKSKVSLSPLVVDITDPTPATGFANHAYDSFLNRIKPDIITALAVIHHLAITRYLSLNTIADFLSKHCRVLIIEFVPRDDPKVRELLRHREDIFHQYTREDFETTFSRFFTLLGRENVAGTHRTLYLYQCHNGLPG